MFSSTSVQAKIVDTLIYFDVLSMPLTARELHRWIAQEARYKDILHALEGLCVQGVIVTDRGFYFLAGRGGLVATRLSRYSLSLPRLKRAWMFARVLAYFPWVEGIALYSSTSFFNVQETSDLDFFIVAKAGRVWSCRFWVNVLLKLFRLRPSDVRKANTLCVSFLVDRSHLDLSMVVQGDGSEHYLYGTSQFIFLYGNTALREDFYQTNAWIRNSLPQWQSYAINSKRRATVSHNVLKMMPEYVLGLVSEAWYRRIQMHILPDVYKEIANLDTRVIINDYMIKLHHRDGRDWVAQQLKQRRSSFGYESNS